MIDIRKGQAPAQLARAEFRVLPIEPYNKDKFVRFHSFQALFLGLDSIPGDIVLTLFPVRGELEDRSRERSGIFRRYWNACPGFFQHRFAGFRAQLRIGRRCSRRRGTRA